MIKLNSFLLCCVLGWSGTLYAQTDYSNNKQLAQRVTQLSKTYPQYVKSKVLTKTLSGADVWMLTLGTGHVEMKPAVAVVGGVDGAYLVGVELAIGFAEQLLSQSSADSVRKLLDTQTFYVFPNMSPDATEQYFSSVRYERRGNARSVDFDRDGLFGEDGYDDLDGDGKITWMRVEDVLGDYVASPQDPRVMVKADGNTPADVKKYSLYTEGVDNDHDGFFNEDRQEGIFFDKNNTYNYKNFAEGAGEHAVSELENRALLDFLYDAFNVYAVVSFGPYNNLSQVERRGNQGGESPSAQMGRRPGGRKITSWSDRDIKANVLAADIYKGLFPDQPAKNEQGTPGNFAEWAYYHYGRLSFSTPGWWLPKVKADSTDRRKGAGLRATEDDEQLQYFKWADQTGVADNYSVWSSVQHPDFPNSSVEVGGIHPFVLKNPPYSYVGDLVAKHTQFIQGIAAMAPQVQLLNVNTEKVDQGLTRITAKVANTGIFPTLTQVGEHSYFLKQVNVRLKTGAGQKIVSGRASQVVPSLDGKQSEEFSWLVQGAGRIVLEAGSASTGSQQVELTL